MKYFVNINKLKEKYLKECGRKNGVICGEKGFCKHCICQVILTNEEYNDILADFKALYASNQDKLEQKIQELENNYKGFIGNLTNLKKMIEGKNV